ncbi:hypothetical protein [Nocardia asteroides]|uniref:hypothetical protein n=1 Tax=Nocardia asteroides TaxID=1824 RepID=UPI001E2ECBC8|nr:hypothetical protein [Nocardia asteroides]UGT52739.1 hypothetical protein LTT85_18655 [Nocardia asteroides]
MPGSGPARALTYPLLVTCGTLAVIAAWVPFADLDQVSALAVVAVGVVGFTAYQLGLAFGVVPSGLVARGRVGGRRVRQQHRLVSRSWLEITSGDRMVWQPVFYDPELSTLTPTELELSDRAIRTGELRFYPSGRVRTTEPTGKLIDNPTRPTPVSTFTPLRRLLLDSQPAVAAPFFALLWIYVMNGDLTTFIGTTTVAATTFTWLSAIRGSDPS